MDIRKIREKMVEYHSDYMTFSGAIAASELNDLDLTDEELETAINRIMDIYWHYDYATIQGIAVAYARWYQNAKDTNDIEDWIATYEIGDWR